MDAVQIGIASAFALGANGCSPPRHGVEARQPRFEDLDCGQKEPAGEGGQKRRPVGAWAGGAGGQSRGDTREPEADENAGCVSGQRGGAPECVQPDPERSCGEPGRQGPRKTTPFALAEVLSAPALGHQHRDGRKEGQQVDLPLLHDERPEEEREGEPGQGDARGCAPAQCPRKKKRPREDGPREDAQVVEGPAIDHVAGRRAAEELVLPVEGSPELLPEPAVHRPVPRRQQREKRERGHTCPAPQPHGPPPVEEQPHRDASDRQHDSGEPLEIEGQRQRRPGSHAPGQVGTVLAPGRTVERHDGHDDRKRQEGVRGERHRELEEGEGKHQDQGRQQTSSVSRPAPDPEPHHEDRCQSGERRGKPLRKDGNAQELVARGDDPPDERRFLEKRSALVPRHQEIPRLQHPDRGVGVHGLVAPLERQPVEPAQVEIQAQANRRERQEPGESGERVRTRSVSDARRGDWVSRRHAYWPERLGLP